jgi:DMSO/TMAO reductase YedYZ molybdopterin-dependent catalytic subunit
MTDDSERPAQPSKLTLSKERWARDGRLPARKPGSADGPRLPPGQHLVTNWPVLDLGAQPEIVPQRWNLQVYGAVATPLNLDLAGLMALPQTASRSDMHCVTSWSRYDNEWSGVSTRDLIAAVQPRADAAYVLLHSYDGYTTNLTLADFAEQNALLAVSWSGKPLTREHGGPVRVIVPHLYLWKSAKWIRQIEFRTHDAPGFWEVHGYHNRADPWKEERYA